MTARHRVRLCMLLAPIVIGTWTGAALASDPGASPTPAPPAGPAAPASPSAPAGEMVGFETGGEIVRGYLAQPKLEGARPGIVLIHEWWGLNDQIKGVADRLGALGFLTIAPDLYGGRVADEPGLAHELMRGLNEGRAVAIIKAAIDYLKHYDGAADRSVGTLGFCMGGGYSLQAALRGADVRATVMFYGSVETTKEAVMPLRAPLLGIFGAQDRGIAVEDVKKFEAALRAAHKRSLILIYQNVGHAFMNEAGLNYNKTVADSAWARATRFLTEALRPLPKRPAPAARTPPAGTKAT